MKFFTFSTLLIFLLISCSKKELVTVDATPEVLIDESTLIFQDGFTCRKINTNIKEVLPAEKSVLLLTSQREEEELIKFHIPSQSTLWNAPTWYWERAGVGNNHYQNEGVIFFRHGHHDFAIDLEDGTLTYDEELDGCPSSSITGIGDYYFTRSTVIDEITQHEKEIILIGDIQQPGNSEILVSPQYDTLGNNNRLGRIMGIHPFENEFGELLLAIRFFDFNHNSSGWKDLFAVYNVTNQNWTVEEVLLDYHDSGTQTMEANGLIYYGSQSYVSCLDTKTGDLKWYTEASTLAPTYLMSYADEGVFVKQGEMLQRRQAETGDLIWETTIGNAQRFTIIQNKLFSLGREFLIIDIETGEILHSYSSPYVDYNPDYYFGYASDMMGYYDDTTKRTHIFINNGNDMICYEIDD